MSLLCNLGFHNWVDLDDDISTVRGCRRCHGFERYHDLHGWSPILVQDIQPIQAWDRRKIAYLLDTHRTVITTGKVETLGTQVQDLLKYIADPQPVPETVNHWLDGIRRRAREIDTEKSPRVTRHNV